MKPPPTLFLARFYPWGGFIPLGLVLCHSGVVLSPPFFGGGCPLKGVVLSPQKRSSFPPTGWFYPPIGSFGWGITPLWWFYPPLFVILWVNLEPLPEDNCVRSTCGAVKRTPLGMGVGACRISILGVEVGEVTEGQGTTYGFPFSVLLYIHLCICVIGHLPWLGTLLQIWDGNLDMVWVCYSSSSTCIAFVASSWWHCSYYLRSSTDLKVNIERKKIAHTTFVCCVISFVALVA